MPDALPSRRLTTIVALDVAGYSARMERDEASTTAEVATLRDVIHAVASEYAGRVFNSAGDGFMLEFSSASAALKAAQALASGCEPKVRIGVHLGEVEVQPNGDLIGHDVNVTARLMQRSDPGSVLVSADVYRKIRGPLAHCLVSRGKLPLDKMTETIEVFDLRGEAAAVEPAPPRHPSVPPAPDSAATSPVASDAVKAAIAAFGPLDAILQRSRAENNGRAMRNALADLEQFANGNEVHFDSETSDVLWRYIEAWRVRLGVQEEVLQKDVTRYEKAGFAPSADRQVGLTRTALIDRMRSLAGVSLLEPPVTPAEGASKDIRPDEATEPPLSPEGQAAVERLEALFANPKFIGNDRGREARGPLTPSWLTKELHQRGYGLEELADTAPHCVDELAKRGIVTREAALVLFDDVRARDLVQGLYRVELPLTRGIKNVRDAYGFCTWGSRIHITLRDNPDALQAELGAIALDISGSRLDEERTDLVATDRRTAESLLGRCVEGCQQAFERLPHETTNPTIRRRAKDAALSLNQWINRIENSRWLPSETVTLVRAMLVQLFYCHGRYTQYVENEDRNHSWREAQAAFVKLWSPGGLYDQVTETLRPPEVRGAAAVSSPSREIRNLVRTETGSATSRLPPEEALANATRTFNELIAAARRGDDGAMADIPQVFSNIKGLALSLYGSTSRFYDVTDPLLAEVEALGAVDVASLRVHPLTDQDRPHIVYDSCDAGSAKLLSPGGPSARFVHVLFRNDSTGTAAVASAREVWARVEFFKPNSRHLLLQMEGRWSSTPQPERGGPILRSTVDLPPNGRPESLDIAIRYSDEPYCYAYNNENLRSPIRRDNRHQPHELHPGRYDISVTLRGVGLAPQTWRFTLTNDSPVLDIEPKTPS